MSKSDTYRKQISIFSTRKFIRSKNMCAIFKNSNLYVLKICVLYLALVNLYVLKICVL